MANSSSADLMDIGQHCSAAGCGQIDFLPFKCDCCSRTFCLEHRTYESHKCPNAGSRQTEAFVCPLCAKAVKMRPGQDANQAFAQHQRTGCDTTNYNRVHKKPVCPVKGCREKLNTINTYTCKVCGLEVCLNHRLSQDHPCEETIAARRAEQRARWNPFVRTPPQPAQRTRKPNPPSRPVQSRLLQQQPSRDASGAAERCPQCGDQFSNIQDLIQHVETQHRIGGVAGGQTEACPRCGQQFADPVALVKHVEKGRCGRTSACVLS
ncbi:hypothetical protein BSKO_00639 [Bryopsis sp. KO-2023]|nr:hypothetical protein BSKO_00639 [Bryopsis sp. KO-2023]